MYYPLPLFNLCRHFFMNSCKNSTVHENKTYLWWIEFKCVPPTWYTCVYTIIFDTCYAFSCVVALWNCTRDTCTLQTDCIYGDNRNICVISLCILNKLSKYLKKNILIKSYFISVDLPFFPFRPRLLFHLIFSLDRFFSSFTYLASIIFCNHSHFLFLPSLVTFSLKNSHTSLHSFSFIVIWISLWGHDASSDEQYVRTYGTT